MSIEIDKSKIERAETRQVRYICRDLTGFPGMTDEEIECVNERTHREFLAMDNRQPDLLFTR